MDAQKIRDICNNHGIIIHLDPQCRGGEILKEVKEERNNLAHGTISFVECGRNYSIDDLKKNKEMKQNVFYENNIKKWNERIINEIN